MSNNIDFYFDFSSPYGYFASTKIDALAEKYGRQVNWRPILLGAIFKITGSGPLITIPFKSDYAVVDIPRCARYYKVPFQMPSVFPIASHVPSRAVYWVKDTDAALSRKLGRALFHAYFAENRDISKLAVTIDVASSVGIDREALASALHSPTVKEKLRHETQAAIDKKVFGSPFIIVDGTPFWGVDRFEQIDHWLATGGW